MIYPIDVIIQLFVLVDSYCSELPLHPQSKLNPTEIIVLALLKQLKSMSIRRFHKWVQGTGYFPELPDYTRLHRLFQHYREVLKVLGQNLQQRQWLVVDSKVCELIHPIREHRRPQSWRGKNKSKGRWHVGVKVAVLLNERGRIVNWQILPAHAHDTWFDTIYEPMEPHERVLADFGFKSKDDHPEWIHICQRGEQNERMIVESFFSQLKRLTSFERPNVRSLKGLETFYNSIMALAELLMELNDRLGIDYKHPKLAHFFIL
jgi:hypothetical protein